MELPSLGVVMFLMSREEEHACSTLHPERTRLVGIVRGKRGEGGEGLRYIRTRCESYTHSLIMQVPFSA